VRFLGEGEMAGRSRRNQGPFEISGKGGDRIGALADFGTGGDPSALIACSYSCSAATSGSPATPQGPRLDSRRRSGASSAAAATSTVRLADWVASTRAGGASSQPSSRCAQARKTNPASARTACSSSTTSTAQRVACPQAKNRRRAPAPPGTAGRPGLRRWRSPLGSLVGRAFRRRAREWIAARAE